jgi:hypothetical protein
MGVERARRPYVGRPRGDGGIEPSCSYSIPGHYLSGVNTFREAFVAHSNKNTSIY